MTTVSEVYFLVRVGTWDEDDLAEYINQQVSAAEDTVYDQAYEEGHREGYEEGQIDLQKEAIDSIRSLR